MGRFKAFPKTPSGNIDKEKVREQYLAGENYVWSKFCAKHGYNQDLRREFPIASWHYEWIATKSERRAELFTEDALSLQSEILPGRVSVLRAQLEANQTLRSVLSKTIAVAQASPTPMSPKELQQLINAQKTLQQCEFDSLLMSAHISKEPLELDSVHIHASEDREGERLRNIPNTLMNGEVVTEEKMAELYKKWVDQSETNDLAKYGADPIEPLHDDQVPLDTLEPY
jgi:hypothetical protein